MSNDLSDKLTKLKQEELCLRKNIDINYYDRKIRIMLFKRQQVIQAEIKKLEFKQKLERELENANNNTIKPNNQKKSW